MTLSMHNCNSRCSGDPIGARSYRAVEVFANSVGSEAGVASAAACESFITGRPLTARFGCSWPTRTVSEKICPMMKSSN